MHLKMAAQNEPIRDVAILVEKYAIPSPGLRPGVGLYLQSTLRDATPPPGGARG
ncbi:hypothetical protein PLANPX_3528 [Lacipirellula parvula]|uniref:Uncharacterized protein n=1 Tax=Lacipirellula parvula TaxID=2650471 RepID=A0A5K7XI05_9BACT|nr:hypothetical protein PLANPX_3528 [Lacipirellula parvula]